MRFLKLDFSESSLYTLMDAVLRTPGLFFIDGSHMGLTNHDFFENITSSVVRLGGIILGFAILILPFKTLVNFYIHLLCLGFLVLCNFMSTVYIQEEIGEVLKPQENFTTYYFRQFQHFGCVLTASLFIAWGLDVKAKHLQAIPMLYVLPLVTRLFALPVDAAGTVHDVVAYIVLTVVVIYGLTVGSKCLKTLKETFDMCQLFFEVYGFYHSSVMLLSNLVDPIEFILFWNCLLFNQFWKDLFASSERSEYILTEADWGVYVLFVISEICYSPLSLIASCVTVMVTTTGIVRAVSEYLASCKSHAPPSTFVQSGLTEGTAMFLLAMQTGLIDLKMPERIGAMTVVLFIVLTSLLQTILEVTHPVLLALSTSSRNVWSHVKALALCVVLFALPCYMNYILMSTVDLDIWTIVVISSSQLTSIQVVGHVIHYALYLYDSRQPEPIESMDDIVYYLKASISSLELISALFVVGAGIKDGWSGDWSLLHSVVLTIHCYFNVYIRIKKGWRSFILRQSAALRIDKLKNATSAELKALNDVCSICYSEMIVSAKVTPCGHIFHGGCLKKWLRIQDNCPMCNAKIIEEDTDENETDSEEVLAEDEDDE